MDGHQMNMQRLLEQLKVDEGVKYEIYLDHLKYPTFGIGHLIVKTDPEYGQPVGTPVSEERVVECFELDIQKSIKACQAIYGDEFDTWKDELQEILVNMAFNLGQTRLNKFVKFRAALQANDFKKAAAEGRNSLWYKQVPNRAERLMRRLENIT